MTQETHVAWRGEIASGWGPQSSREGGWRKRRHRGPTTPITSVGSRRACDTQPPRQRRLSSKTSATRSMFAPSSGACKRPHSCSAVKGCGTGNRHHLGTSQNGFRGEVRRTRRQRLHTTAGNIDDVIKATEHFVESIRSEQSEFDRVLATVLFTDIVGSTHRAAELGDRGWRELVERHHTIVRSLLGRYRGVEVDTAGDGFFATFDGPARAIRCAKGSARLSAHLGSRSERVCTPVRLRRSTTKWEASQ